jgi:uncharacterized coiled-coil protein SlyX
MDRLESLESKIAFLEQANAQLSDELLHQRRQVEQLRIEVEALAARLRAAASDDAPQWSVEDERPPHY